MSNLSLVIKQFRCKYCEPALLDYKFVLHELNPRAHIAIAVGLPANQCLKYSYFPLCLPPAHHTIRTPVILLEIKTKIKKELEQENSK